MKMHPGDSIMSRLQKLSPPSSLRLVFVIPTVGAGGAERVAAILCNAWQKLGHEVHLITFEDDRAESHYFLERHIQVHRLDLLRQSRSFANFAYLNLKRVYRIRRTLRLIAPDAVVSFMPEPNVLTILASLGKSWPVIVSERVHPAYLPLGRFPAIMRKLTYRYAAAVVAQARSIAEYIDKTFDVSSTIIPNPIDLTSFIAPERGQAEHPGTKRIISLGRLESQKGFDVLLNAFARLSTRFPDWTLVIFGEGSRRAALEQQIFELGLHTRVQMPGIITDVASELQQTDIYVQSSHFEGTPNAVIEALACGCPVVATDCPGGTREIIGDDAYGILVPVNDPIALATSLAHLMSDEAARNISREKAPYAVASLSVPIIAARWIELIQKTIHSHP